MSLYEHIELFFMDLMPLEQIKNAFVIAHYDTIIAFFTLSLIVLAFVSWILLTIAAIRAVFSIRRRF